MKILDSDDKEPEFWEPLGGFHEISTTSSASLSDAQIKEEEEKSTTLYKVKDSGEIVKVEELPLVTGLLDSSSCFILDCETEVYIWSGKNAGNLKQSVAIILAQEFKNVFSDRPTWVSITSIFEGEEPICFKERFLFWDEKTTAPRPILPPRVQPGAQKGKEFDVMKMMVTPVTIPPTSHTIPTSPSSSSLSVTSPSSPFPSISPSASSISPSSLSSLSLSIPFPSGDSEAPPPVKPAKAWEGLKKVETQYERTLYGWKSTASGWEEMEEEDFGQFYSNRCYVYHVIFTPEVGKSQSQVYFWQGIIAANRFWISFKFEILPAIEERMGQMDGITPSTIQLQQHKETPAFLDLFDGKIIYHESSRGFNVRLYQVRTDNTGRQRASQCVTADLNNLNSGDSFIFWNFVRTSFFVWHGKGSPPSTRSFSLSVVTTLKSSCLPSSHNQAVYLTKEIDEGKEMYEFWQHSGLTPAGTSSTTLTNTSSQSLFVAGAESKYASDSWLRDPSRKPPRLFVCHEDLFSGLFSVTYSPYICQSLMSHTDVVIVDVFHTVFVWVGSRASPYKKEMGTKTAALYIAKSTLGHAPTTPIVPVSEGHEPLSFKSLFLSWRAKAADYVDPFASRPITPKVTSGSSGSGSKDSFAISSILKRRHMFGGRDDDEEDEALPQTQAQPPSSPGASPTKPKKAKPTPINPPSTNAPTSIPSSPSASRIPSGSPNSRRLAKPLSVDVLDLESTTSSLSPSPSTSSPLSKSPKISRTPKTPRSQISPSSPNNNFKKIGNADVLEITHSDSENESENEEDYMGSPHNWDTTKSDSDDSVHRSPGSLVKSVSENNVNPSSTPTKTGVVVEGASYSVASIVSNFDHLLSSKELEARNSKLRGHVKRSPSMGSEELLQSGNIVRKSPSLENVETKTGRSRSGSGGSTGSRPAGNFEKKDALHDLEPIEEVEAQTEPQNEGETEHEHGSTENGVEEHENLDEQEGEEGEQDEKDETTELEGEEAEETEEAGTEEEDHDAEQTEEPEETEEIEEIEETVEETEPTEEDETNEEEAEHPTENGTEEHVAEVEDAKQEEQHEDQDNAEPTEHVGHDEDTAPEEHETDAVEAEEHEPEEHQEKESEDDTAEEHESETQQQEKEPETEKTEEDTEAPEEEETDEKEDKPKPPKKTTTKPAKPAAGLKTAGKKPAAGKAPAKPSSTTSKSKPAAPTSKSSAKAPAKPAAPKASAKTPAKPGAKPAAKATTSSSKSAAKPAAKAAAKPAPITTKTLAPKKAAAVPKSPTATSSATKVPVTAKPAASGVRKPAATTKPAATPKPAAGKTTTAKPAAPTAKKEVAKPAAKPVAPAKKAAAVKAPAKTSAAPSKPASSTSKLTNSPSDAKKVAPKPKTKTNAA